MELERTIHVPFMGNPSPMHFPCLKIVGSRRRHCAFSESILKVDLRGTAFTTYCDEIVTGIVAY